MATVADVAERARKVYMNDANVELYSNEIMLPFIQQAYGEMQLELNLNGLSTNKEISTVLTIGIGINVITNIQIVDMVMPLDLFERAVGEGDDKFVRMEKTSWESNTLPSETLKKWNWRENEIKLIGSTADREVKVRYIKGLTILVNENNVIGINNSTEFLAAKSAGLASRFIGGNIGRADSCDNDAGRILPRLVALEVKNNQSIAVRRKPFGYRRHV